MFDCRITKDGLLIYLPNDDDEDIGWKKASAKASQYLSLSCEIDEGVTLGEVLALVQEDEMVQFFLTRYSHCNIDVWNATLKDEVEPSDLDYLEIAWRAELFDSRVDIHTDLGGISISEDMNYSISGSSLAKYAHLPVKLNTRFEMYKYPNVGEQYPKDNEDLKIVKGDRTFTLLEVLDAIYYDISFYGNPENADKIMKEMQETIKKYEDGELETISWEEMQRQLDEKPE